MQLNQDYFSLCSCCCKPFAKEISWSALSCFLFSFSVALIASLRASPAQENPYIVTYDHYLEEPGNLEIEYFSTFGTQRGGNDFHAFWMEFEYGATAWWTTEFYLDGQTTFNDSTLFTGFRWENRFRPLKHEHFINPVIYIEYENTSGADKILKEVEGHDVEEDRLDPNAIARKEHDMSWNSSYCSPVLTKAGTSSKTRLLPRTCPMSRGNLATPLEPAVRWR